MASDEPTGRTLQVNGKLIRQLRLKKGWTPERLANEARCSVKTIKNVEASKKIYLATLDKIARALGEGDDPAKLLDRRSDYAKEAIPFDATTIPTRVEVIFQGDIQEFDETSDLFNRMRDLASISGTRGKIIVIAVTETNSIRVELEMSDLDCLTFVESYGARQLDQLGIIYITIPTIPRSSFNAAELIRSPINHPLLEPANQELLSGGYWRRYLQFVDQLKDKATAGQNTRVQITNYSVTIIAEY